MTWNPFSSDAAESVLAQKIIGAVIRHGLTALGGYLVTKGFVDQAGWAETSAGIAAGLTAFIWSVYQKHKQEAEKTALAR